MRREKKLVASFFLSAALMAPLGAFAMPVPQDDRDHERHEREEHRVYDKEHRDYHNWNDDEDRVYRHWLEERHDAYVDFNQLDARRQRAYWKWRHEHQEHEEHEHQ